MPIARRKPRGRPFQPGNPGRPPGARNKTTQLAAQFADSHAEAVFQKLVELAKAGDVACIRILIDRIWPVRRGQPVSVSMPPINSAQDLFPALASIWTGIRDGELTPDEASALSIVVDRSIEAVEVHEITKRITALEEARDRRDEKSDPKSA